MDAAWDKLLPVKLAFYEIIVIEILIRQVQVVVPRLFRPAGPFIRTAFRAGFGAERNSRAAMGANVRCHGFLIFD